jgi:hypothetical protein
MTDGFGTPSYQLVCGACHDTTQGAQHHDSSRTIKMQSGFQFGSSAPTYSGTVGASSAAAPKTCSNVSCHYQTTPVWAAY